MKILQLTKGKYTFVDDEDYDRHNQKVNLRMVTRAQNNANQSVCRGGRSKYKGVYWHQIAGKWMGQIKITGKPKYLGLFVNEEDAARAYDTAAQSLFGDYAKRNFSTSDSTNVS